MLERKGLNFGEFVLKSLSMILYDRRISVGFSYVIDMVIFVF